MIRPGRRRRPTRLDPACEPCEPRVAPAGGAGGDWGPPPPIIAGPYATAMTGDPTDAMLYDQLNNPAPVTDPAILADRDASDALIAADQDARYGAGPSPDAGAGGDWGDPPDDWYGVAGVSGDWGPDVPPVGQDAPAS